MSNTTVPYTSIHPTSQGGYDEKQSHDNPAKKKLPKFFQPLELHALCKSKAKKPQAYPMEPIWHTVRSGKCYVHKEGTQFNGRLIPISCLPASRNFPNNSRNVLAFLDSCPGIDNKWVSLPAYAVDDKSTIVYDFQCATTGTKSDDEPSFEMTSSRECAEENGIDVTSGILLASTQFEHSKKQVHGFVYWVSQVLPASKDTPQVPKDKDNSAHKIMSWVLFDSPEQIQNRSRANVSTSGDSAGVLTVVMRVSDLKNIIQLCF
jgi:hypothetical protein